MQIAAFNRNEFRADFRRVLLAGHGVMPKDATRPQLASALNTAAGYIAGFYEDKPAFRAAVQSAVKDYFKGK